MPAKTTAETTKPSGSDAPICSASFKARTDAISEATGIPLRELAVALGFSPATMFSCRRGDRKPSGKILIKIEKAEIKAGLKAPTLSAPSLSPSRESYSREELTGLMCSWMREKLGDPENMTSEDRKNWINASGYLFWFIQDHFPSQNALRQPPLPAGDSTNTKDAAR